MHEAHVTERISDTDNTAWDRLTASSGLFLHRHYLRALETTRPANLAPRYALVSHHREWVAAVAAQRIDIEDAAGLRARLLVCGNVFACGSGGVAPQCSWPAVSRALEQIDRAEGRRADAWVLKDLAGAPPRGSRFRALATEPDMVLDLDDNWTTFDDYLAALKARYRRAARRVARQLESEGFRVERLKDLRPHAEQLHALYLQVHGMAKVRLATSTASYLPALAEALGEGLRCTVIRRDDEIAAFVTTLADGDSAIGYQVGFDREIAGRVPLYPRLLHAAVADALTLGCRRLCLGRTALDSKARLGARPRHLEVWVRGRGLRGQLLGLVGRVGRVGRVRPDEVPLRRPFKAI